MYSVQYKRVCMCYIQYLLLLEFVRGYAGVDDRCAIPLLSVCLLVPGFVCLSLNIFLNFPTRFVYKATCERSISGTNFMYVVKMGSTMKARVEKRRDTVALHSRQCPIRHGAPCSYHTVRYTHTYVNYYSTV
jgi:hypothetical protein